MSKLTKMTKRQNCPIWPNRLNCPNWPKLKLGMTQQVKSKNSSWVEVALVEIENSNQSSSLFQQAMLSVMSIPNWESDDPNFGVNKVQGSLAKLNSTFAFALLPNLYSAEFKQECFN